MTTARTSAGASISKDDGILIREVWEYNLAAEIELIREVVDDYPYIAMDTEFPGVVCRPIGISQYDPEYNYAHLRHNVNILKLIQLGLTFSDKNGNLPKCGTNQQCVWQINFREFDEDFDWHSIDSIDLLKKSGIDFRKNKKCGVDSKIFGELFMSSGVVLNDNMQWITFHGACDFGYLIKSLKNQILPEKQVEFLTLFRTYFPISYDVKYLMRFSKQNLHGGLSKLAELLQVKRFGRCHQAASDSLLTSRIFWKLKQGFINGPIEPYSGLLYDLCRENGFTAT